MTTNKERQPLASRTIFTWIISILIITIVISTSIYRLIQSHQKYKQERITQTQKQLQLLADSEVRSLEEEIEDIVRYMIALSKSSNIWRREPNKTDSKAPGNPVEFDLERFIFDSHRELIDSLYQINDEGIATAGLPDSAGYTGKDFSNLPGVAHLLKHRSSSAPFIALDTDKRSLSICVPIFDVSNNQSDFRGLLHATILLDTLIRQLQKISFDGNGHAWLEDSEKRIIVHTSGKSIGLPHEDAEENHDELIAHAGITTLNLRWFLGISLPYDVIAAPIDDHARDTYFFVLIRLFLFVLLVGYFYFRNRKRSILIAERDNLRKIADTTEELKRVNRWLKKERDERKTSDKALTSSQRRFWLHMKQTPLAVIEWNTALEVVEWNPAAEKIFGYSKKEALGKHAAGLIVPESAQAQTDEVWEAILSRKGGERNTNENITKQGDIIYCEWYNTLLVDEKGETVGVVSLAHDITDRIQVESKLRLTQYSIDNSSSAAFWIKQNGQIHYANKAACLLTGYSHQELSDVYLWDLESGFSRNAFSTLLQKLEENGTVTFESIYTDRDGRRFPVEIIANLQEFEKEKYIFTYVQDISERVRSEMEQTRLVSAIEQSSDNVIITDVDGNIEYVNPAFERNTGYSWAEVFGENPRIIKSGSHEDGFYQNLWETISRGEIWSSNIVNKRKDGQLIEESATIFPVLNSVGEITNFVGVKRDMTEQNKLEKQLRHSQKLEAIGTLVSGIAHDFNNILGAIFAFTQLSQRKLSDSPELQDVDGYLDRIFSAASRAKELVDQILTFSHKGKYDPTNIDISPLIKESMKFLRATLPTTISINLDIEADLRNIYCDATQIQQVIMNLCTNASHAMEEKGGTLEVALSNCRIDHRATETGNLEPGNYVLLVVSDTGKGMSDEIKQRIFEPFFTSKEKGKGTGLGLSVVHGIVSKHQGAVRVFSQEGLGTKFNIYLPAATDHMIEMKKEDEPELPTGSESILFIDDEIDLCNAYGEMITIQGYQVLTKSSSRDALQAFSEDPDSYDLVITDYTMPEMNGIELAGEIHKHKQEIPIILISGVEQLVPEEDLKTAGIIAKYPKPVNYKTLMKGIRKALDNA